MLASVIDLLAAANWQRAGKKNNPKPKPIRRPDEKPKLGTSMPVDDFEAAYARATARVAEIEEGGGVAWQ